MTRDEIEKLQATRETDALIGKEVFGLDVRMAKSWEGDLSLFGGGKVTFVGEFTDEREWVEEGDYYFVADGRNHLLPEYTREIAAAWKVVEKMGESGYLWTVQNDSQIRRDSNSILCAFYLGPSVYASRCGTAPLTICRAALLAVMENQE